RDPRNAARLTSRGLRTGLFAQSRRLAESDRLAPRVSAARRGSFAEIRGGRAPALPRAEAFAGGPHSHRNDNGILGAHGETRFRNAVGDRSTAGAAGMRLAGRAAGRDSLPQRESRAPLLLPRKEEAGGKRMNGSLAAQSAESVGGYRQRAETAIAIGGGNADLLRFRQV